MIAWARYPYDGTVVLVTGAGSGIGQAIARAFLEQGASVCVTGRHEQPLRETVEEFPEERVLVRTTDVADRAEVEGLVAAIADRFGRLDVAVNNAGVFEGGEIEDYDDAAWERMRSINLDAVLFVARAAVPLLKQSRGNLVAISSVSGLRGDWGQFAYNATKGAVNAMVQSLALDLGAYGVRANVIAPAFTATRLTQDRLDDPAFAAALHNRVALGRAATPEDVARAVLFLAGPDAAYITGAVIPVDGGTTASTGQPRPL
ncbi:SDR family NAD(P)-dependent oxidoreductase [Kocuria rosea]|jgi:meso-butanediol dehydrogenase/(S,S)-butanediol dehydrogenase/diacetyl reductase|uniref:SDR family NAD(P)-dependent oxidoreductase n=1 Tax=Kocuria rosea TaxID=1275 RepID=UPI00204117A7|nr:SDR family oxidoreductase [Kocuria rosea]MCM3688960.1 SDR family oxidoreductase [Kocuria rosea]